jgi:hypothetical protein
MKILRRLVCISGLLLPLMSCSQPIGVDKPAYPSDHKLSSEERKKITDDFLKSHNIPVLPTLPLVEDHTEAKFRKEVVIARRCVILYGLINVGHKARKAEDMVAFFKKHHLWSDVSPSEQEYLLGKDVTDQQNTNMIWRMESLNVLLWALGHFDVLPLPTQICDSSDYKNLPDIESHPLNWIQNSRLRNTEDILNEADLIYRIHWATTEARLKNIPMPFNLNNDVVYERHYALNWLIMYAEDWDEISTDT